MFFKILLIFYYKTNFITFDDDSIQSYTTINISYIEVSIYHTNSLVPG